MSFKIKLDLITENKILIILQQTSVCYNVRARLPDKKI